MRYQRTRITLSLLVAVPLAIILSTGCASVHDPRYDGEIVQPEALPNSILVTIENHRTIDAIPPTFYLVGSGRHSLGVVEGMNGKKVQLIDVRYLDVDGCYTVLAHYVGQGDFVYDRACWKRGESIWVSLDNIFTPNAAWSHR